ncbi:MAG: extracellular solute-binding protein [Leptolyngbya sp. SIO3F4]|nr:extracellular solute-binding protein [Leptolyngbya sp. SIO3F4]
MVKRRTVVWGLLGTAIASCYPSNSSPFKVKLLARSVPSQVLKAFNRETFSKFDTEPSLLDIYQQLQLWQSKKSSTPPLWRRLLSFWGSDSNNSDSPTVDTSLVTLSDPWLEHAIRQQLIQPLPEFALAERLPEPWQRLLRRDRQGHSTARGELWAVPYRTQGLMIAYQKPIFNAYKKAITKWADLWRPELAGKIAMPNHPRLAAAVVLKALGYSANDEDALAQDDVQEQLVALYRQVKVFDSRSYLKALVNEDVWIAVGWSGDILATLVRYRGLGSVVPQEGSVLTSDLWVAPAAATERVDAVQTWMKFCWEMPIATQISISSNGLSPLFFLPDIPAPKQLPPETLLMIERGEVMLPLSNLGQEVLAELFSSEALLE